ncbi:neutral/alkaline non-lysosomal ceramidase C-terminal domain-containing protein [Streptodolium elevatio]
MAAEFVAGHPSTELRRGGTYLEVEHEAGADVWTRVADDGDWATRLHWTRGTGPRKRYAVARVEWDTTGAAAGRYRLRFHGDTEDGPFTGVSEAFDVPA